MNAAFSPSVSSAVGEVGHEAGDHDALARRRGGRLDEGVHVLGAGAEAAHAGVELQVDPSGRPAAGAAAAAPHRLRRPGGHLGVERGGARPTRRRASGPITRSGPSMPAARRARASPTAATASAVAPPSQGRARDRDRAVAVAVGLDDRHQPGAAGGPGEPRGVVPDRREIDPGDARARAHAAGLASAAGSASMTSEAIVPSPRPVRSPARACTATAATAAAGRHALGEERRDHPGEHVAGAGGGQRRRAAVGHDRRRRRARR